MTYIRAILASVVGLSACGGGSREARSDDGVRVLQTEVAVCASDSSGASGCLSNERLGVAVAPGVTRAYIQGAVEAARRMYPGAEIRVVVPARAPAAGN